MYAVVEGDAGDQVSAVAVNELGNQPAVVFHALPRAHDRSGRGELERPAGVQQWRFTRKSEMRRCASLNYDQWSDGGWLPAVPAAPWKSGSALWSASRRRRHDWTPSSKPRAPALAKTRSQAPAWLS